jgi:hypothetical protein
VAVRRLRLAKILYLETSQQKVVAMLETTTLELMAALAVVAQHLRLLVLVVKE